jgi:hypothetical protein
LLVVLRYIIIISMRVHNGVNIGASPIRACGST